MVKPRSRPLVRGIPTKISKATIEAAWWRRKKPGHRLIVRDKDCRGLALIINPTTMTWSYAYRSRGTDPVTGRRWPNRTITLGNPASHSPDDARAEANRIKGQAVAGVDPAAERRHGQRMSSARVGPHCNAYWTTTRGCCLAAPRCAAPVSLPLNTSPTR
jgi:hypothetical protein